MKKFPNIPTFVIFQWNMRICYTNKKIRNQENLLPLPPFIDELLQLTLQDHGVEFNLDEQKKEYVISQHFPPMYSVKLLFCVFFTLHHFDALREHPSGKHTCKLEHLLLKKIKLDA